MPVYFDKSKERWRFTFNRIIENRRTRYTKLLPQGWSRTRAEAYDRRETGSLYAQAKGLESPSPRIDHAVAIFLEHRIPQLRSGHGIARVLAAMLEWYEERTFDELADVAHEYTAAHPKLAPASLRNHLGYLRMACRYAWKYHKLGKGQPKPGEDMVLPVPRNERQTYLDGKELTKLWRSFDDTEARDLYKLAFYTGLRWIRELLPRTPEDVIRNKGVWLRVPSSSTKNAAPRMVPIIDEAALLLNRLPFKGSPRFYYNAFMRARNKAGFADLYAHDLRHSLASAIISGQGTLSDVGAALGHKDIGSSRRYAHLYPSHLRDVLGKATKKMHTTKRRAIGKK